MDVMLYSTGCPRCKVLKKKLDGAGVAYSECHDIDVMEEMGIESVPVLSVNGELLDFSSANAWLNDYGNEDGRCDACKLN